MKRDDIIYIFISFIVAGIGAVIGVIAPFLILGDPIPSAPLLWIVVFLVAAIFAPIANNMRHRLMDNSALRFQEMQFQRGYRKTFVIRKDGTREYLDNWPVIFEGEELGIRENIQQKKEDYYNIANVVFLYKDEVQIRTIYNDYFKEPAIEQLVAKMSSEMGGNVKGRLPQVVEAGAGAKDIKEWVSTIKLPDVSVAEMFRRFQRETIRNDQVLLGLELVDVDLSELNEFNRLIKELQVNFDFQIDIDHIERQRGGLKRKAAEKTLSRLENAADWVLVDGKFTINALQDEYYKCVYTHPVNEYLGDDSPTVTITTAFHKDELEPSVAGNYVQSIGKSIPMKVYGKVWMPVDRSQDNWELQIRPLAIY